MYIHVDVGDRLHLCAYQILVIDVCIKLSVKFFELFILNKSIIYIVIPAIIMIELIQCM